MDEKLARLVYQRIEQAKIELLLDQTFFGHLLMHLEFVPTERIKTAGTDGRRVYWNPEFFKDFTIDIIKTVITHEVLHVAFGHHEGYRFYDVKDEQALKWNLACDCIVNQTLLDNDFEMPQINLDAGGSRDNLVYAEDLKFKPELVDPTIAYSSLELYSRLPDPQIIYVDVDCGLMDPGAGGGDDDTKAGKAHQSSDVEKRIWEAKVQAAWNADKRASELAGREPSNVQLIVDKLLKPVIPFFRELADWLQPFDEDYGYVPPDRRSFALNEAVGEEVIWSQMNLGEIFKDIILAVDTSGSMSDKAIIRCCSDVYGMAIVGMNLWLMYADAKVQGVYELSPKPLPPPEGRGGTLFEPVFEEIEARGMNPHALIYFTDGYPNHGWPDPPPYPVAWVLTTDVTPPWGRVLRYPREALIDV